MLQQLQIMKSVRSVCKITILTVKYFIIFKYFEMCNFYVFLFFVDDDENCQ